MKVLIAWSSGKDSAWCLYALQQVMMGRAEVVGLLTTVNEVYARVSMHAVRVELLEAQARAVGVPLWKVFIPSPCTNEQYEAAMGQAVVGARGQGIEAIAFGDLYLEDVRSYREKMMRGTGIKPLFPLWRMPTDLLARDMIDQGVKARLTCVDPQALPAHFIGREFDRSFLDELPSGVDPCGEKGEFHTFAYDGPMFRTPVLFRSGESVHREGFIFLDLIPELPEHTVGQHFRVT